MYGVINPGVSAGSNQVGASVVCTPQVNCPCGAAASTRYGAEAVAAATAPVAVSARTSRRVSPESAARPLRLLIGELTCLAPAVRCRGRPPVTRPLVQCRPRMRDCLLFLQQPYSRNRAILGYELLIVMSSKGAVYAKSVIKPKPDCPTRGPTPLIKPSCQIGA